MPDTENRGQRRRAFFQVGGALAEDAPSYIERPADSDLLAALERDEYCLCLAPRQMGKSSLMVHAKAKLVARKTTRRPWSIGSVTLVPRKDARAEFFTGASS